MAFYPATAAAAAAVFTAATTETAADPQPTPPNTALSLPNPLLTPPNSPTNSLHRLRPPRLPDPTSPNWKPLYPHPCGQHPPFESLSPQLVEIPPPPTH